MKLSKIFAVVFGCCILFSCDQSSDSKIEDQSIGENAPDQWIDLPAKSAKKGKKIVLISGDEEYRSEEALPMMAEILSTHHGFDCTVLFAQDTAQPGVIDPNYSYHIPGLEQLVDADLMILFTRFRALPAEQMQYIDNYLQAGKPLIGIRTATHAFNYKDTTHAFAHYSYNYNGENEAWHLGFGKVVLGETWYTHHGHHRHQSTRGIIASGAESHPVLNGIPDGSIWGPTDVYGIRTPMEGTVQHLVLGQTVDRNADYDENDAFYGMRESDQKVATKVRYDQENSYNPNDPMPPIVWTKVYQVPGGKAGTSLTSTIGSSTDMKDEEVRRLFVNAVYHLSNLEVPAKAKVDFVSPYNPSAYAFHDDAYWDDKALKINQ